MTGRRLYDQFTDVAAAQPLVWSNSGQPTKVPTRDAPPIAWPFLNQRDRKAWNDLARRITPRRRKP